MIHPATSIPQTLEPSVSCVRCGFATSTTWDRCPSCAAPAGSAPRVPVDCLHRPRPTLPAGVSGERVDLLGAVLVGLLSAVALLTLISATAQLKSAQAISNGDLDASSVAALRDTALILAALGGLTAVVLWFVWLVRVVRNAAAFGLVPQRLSGAWVVTSWLIPVLNIWRPRRILNDAWRGSGGAPTSVISWWWGLWVFALYPLPFLLAAGLGSGAHTRGDYQLLGFTDLIDAVIWIGAAFIAYRLTTLQQTALTAGESRAADPVGAPVTSTLATA